MVAMDQIKFLKAFLLAILTNLVAPSMCHIATRHSKSLSANMMAKPKERFERDIVLPKFPEDTQISLKDIFDWSGEYNPLMTIESICKINSLLQESRIARKGLISFGNEFQDDNIDTKTIEDKFGLKSFSDMGSSTAKRNSGSHSLSIVAPLETLRRVKAYREAVQRIAQQQRQIRDNDQILAEKGKRTETYGE